MRIKIEDEMRTALRQAGAIAAVDGKHSPRWMLALAQELFNAMVLLEPAERSRRVQLIDSIFSQARGRDQLKRGHQ
jgi:hypothetical protein